MNYLDALNDGNKILKANRIKNYSLDTELFLANVLNTTREKILISLKKNLKIKSYNRYKKLVYRRKKNEPTAYILKNKEFWKYKFFVNKHVLIPRPETEIIVEEILKLISLSSTKSILDVGTGSGCIIISLIKERPNCIGTALDICKKALIVAKYNAKMHHIRNKINFVNIDIDKFQHNKYDFIISNPPYIKKFNLRRLDQSVKFFEPHIALEAGNDGLREIKKLINKSNRLLKINGKLIFEIGKNQCKVTKKILKQNGFYINKVINDISSIPRVIISTKII